MSDAAGKLPRGPSTIPAGTYRSLDQDYITIGAPNFAIGRADLPDDLVYQLIRAVFENQPRLVKATSTASNTLPQNVVKDTFLPFHSGAVRFLSRGRHQNSRRAGNSHELNFVSQRKLSSTLRTTGDEKRLERARFLGLNIVRTVENEIGA